MAEDLGKGGKGGKGGKSKDGKGGRKLDWRADRELKQHKAEEAGTAKIQLIHAARQRARSRPLKVVLVQAEACKRDSSVEYGIVLLENVLQAETDVDVVIFPENFIANDGDETRDGTKPDEKGHLLIEAFKAIAKQHHVYVLPGSGKTLKEEPQPQSQP